MVTGWRISFGSGCSLHGGYIWKHGLKNTILYTIIPGCLLSWGFRYPGCFIYLGVLYIGFHCIGDFTVLYLICQHHWDKVVGAKKKHSDFIFRLTFSSGIFGAALGFCHVFLQKTEFSFSMGIIHSLNKVIRDFFFLNIQTLWSVQNPGR